jgi:signal transduction histidine kinase
MLASIRSLIKQLSEMKDDLYVSMLADEKLEIIDYPGKSQIDNQIRLSAYRFVEEAIINAIRHGKATEIRIEAVMTSDNSIELSVIDNGVSFDVGKAVSGVGFASIDARIGQIGGYWRIKSSKGNGTTITAIIPLDIASKDLAQHDNQREQEKHLARPANKATDLNTGTKRRKDTDDTIKNGSAGDLANTSNKKRRVTQS